MKIDSLSEKLILYFILLGLGAIAIISTVSFYSTREALIARTYDQLISLRIVKKNQIEQFYADRFRDIGLMAGTLQPGSHPNLPGAEYNSFKQYFSAFYIFSKEDTLIKGCFNNDAGCSSPEISDSLRMTLLNQLKESTVAISDLYLDRHSGIPCQVMATAITSTETVNHHSGDILMLSISIEAINSIMLNNDPLSGLGLSGETYLIGQDFTMRSTSRFQVNSILRTMVRTDATMAAMEGKSGAITTRDYRNIPVLSSFEMIDIQGLKWAILAEIDVKEAMVPIYETRTRVLILSSIILVVFFGFVLFISRRITRPLVRLRNAAIDLGKGNFDTNLPVETQDEIGALTESFNIMARQIKEKTTELQAERHGRIRSVFDGEEMERQRLSRELHDGIGQSLIAIKLRLENLLYQDGKDINNSIQELKNYFDQIIDEVRRISNNLLPSVLEVFSIPIAFRNLFAETEEHSGLRIHFEATGNFDDLNKKIKTYIYRLTQEALNNIVKHADAREVRVYLTRSTDRLKLVIRDDGKGFLPDSVGIEGGNGIHNMRERASLLQGQIDIQSAPLYGTTITLNVPIITTYVKNQDFPRG
ncbi:MAG: HAMP domain-containing sensor histidine kinase [Bacteroidales bacterium]